jgi:UDP-N-acetylmuramate dehydrogenase
VREEADVALSGLTTLRLGGPARRLLVAETEAETLEAVRSVDAAGESLLVLGGGSNVVVADEGFDGTVLRVDTRRSAPALRGESTHVIGAGVDWDGFVADAVDQGYAGVEALSGIPGLVGAAPIQNIGAYGQELSQTVDRVRVLDRTTGRVVELDRAECGFSYRDSVFKGSERYVVLAVALSLERSRLGGPVRYAELARTLGVGTGDRVPADEVRAAVLDLRRRKGMVLDPADHDTWSAGSFFTNPVLSFDELGETLARIAAHVGPDVKIPQYPADSGGKLSAAWLIERAGFAKGYPGPGNRVALSHSHTLALTNRGDATTSDLLSLAREVRDGVHRVFGVQLVAEPVLVGCEL